MDKSTLKYLVVIAVLLVGTAWLFSQKSVDVQVQIPNELGAVSGPDVYGAFRVHGAFTQGGGRTVATPTSSAYTFTFADMADSNILTFIASSTMPALTATLPASTTIPLPVETGAYRSWIIENPFTAAATTTTIAAGTGIDLQEPDGQNVVIGINNYAWLTCIREASTDVVCRVDESIPAD